MRQVFSYPYPKDIYVQFSPWCLYSHYSFVYNFSPCPPISVYLDVTHYQVPPSLNIFLQWFQLTSLSPFINHLYSSYSYYAINIRIHGSSHFLHSRIHLCSYYLSKIRESDASKSQNSKHQSRVKQSWLGYLLLVRPHTGTCSTSVLFVKRGK